MVTVFHGTTQESVELSRAVTHNCECAQGQRCGAHVALLEQRFVDGILFARYLRERLEAQEGLEEVNRCR